MLVLLPDAESLNEIWIQISIWRDLGDIALALGYFGELENHLNPSSPLEFEFIKVKGRMSLLYSGMNLDSDFI